MIGVFLLGLLGEIMNTIDNSIRFQYTYYLSKTIKNKDAFNRIRILAGKFDMKHSPYLIVEQVKKAEW